MRIYAKVGEDEQIIDESKTPKMPEGYIKMKKPRPDDYDPLGKIYVANEKGEWAEEVSPEEEE